MTENEALNTLHILLAHERAVDAGEINAPNNLNSQEKEALQFILEEIQQYRAIGTVEECRNAYAKGYNQGTIDRAEEVTKAREHGYAKAVQEFSEALHKKCDGMIQSKWNNGVAPVSWANAYADFKDDIDKIAEEMRGAE